MASLDFEKEKVEFKEFYRRNYELFLRADTAFRVLVRSLLSATSDITTQVTSRVKDCEECIGKFSRRYQQGLEANKKEYEIKDYITDLIGIRITCFYESDVDLIVKLLHENFKIAGITDKRALMEAERDTFGYKGVHLDARLSDKRRSLPEYHGIVHFGFEIQVRTIIQHAWSEIDHAISYKKSIPTDLDRRIRTLAALFELADKEFLAIRFDSQELEKEAEGRTPEQIAEQKQPGPLNAFTAMAVLNAVFPKYNFIAGHVDGFVNEILRIKPEMTDRAFALVFETHDDTVDGFAEFVEGNMRRNFNPFTHARHVLYLSDRQSFRRILFDLQRTVFEKWLSEQRRAEKKKA
jgi:putative GTP pyrophosphokinase